MTDEKLSGMALILGSTGMILTMVLHPHGRISPAEVDAMVRKLIAVHSLALASLPLLFLGAWGLSRRLGTANRIVIAALVLYGFATAAVMNAAITDGLVNPSLLREMVAAGKDNPAGDLWRAIFRYNSNLEAAFTYVFVAASSLAILVWSVMILRSRKLGLGLGIYGTLLALGALITLFAGVLASAAHGLSLIIVGEALWFMLAGGLLWLSKEQALAASA